LSAVSAAAIDVAVASKVGGAAALCASVRGRPHGASSSGVVGTGTGGDPSHSAHMRAAIIGLGATPNTARVVLGIAVGGVQLGFGLAASTFDVAAAWPSVCAAAPTPNTARAVLGTAVGGVQLGFGLAAAVFDVAAALGGGPSKWRPRCNLFALGLNGGSNASMCAAALGTLADGSWMVRLGLCFGKM
jgi:hypothetical protein